MSLISTLSNLITSLFFTIHLKLSNLFNCQNNLFIIVFFLFIYYCCLSKKYFRHTYLLLLFSDIYFYLFMIDDSLYILRLQWRFIDVRYWSGRASSIISCHRWPQAIDPNPALMPTNIASYFYHSMSSTLIWFFLL